MSAIAVPIAPDQLDAWKAWNAEFTNGARSADFADFNARMGITSHRVWLFHSPMGPMAIVVHDGPGADDFMAKMGTSDHEFDVWFRDSVSRFHGVDFSAPPPGPPPELMMDWSAG